MCDAGAGTVSDGRYDRVTYVTRAVCTYRALDGAHRDTRQPGRERESEENRIEAICRRDRLDSVLQAVCTAHPYETPAYDCYKLHEVQGQFGLGRIGELEKPMRVNRIVERIKKRTGARAVGIVGDEKRLVKRAAVCAGSCGKIINSVIAAKADLYLTGELKHHHALAAQEVGLTCICLSHSVSERFILKKFSNELQKQLKSVTIRISKKDADPFTWKKL